MTSQAEPAHTVAGAQAHAKRPRTPLAGPYGHPFHPILVTIPIGTWIASVVFDILGFAAEDPTPFVTGAVVLIAIGLIGAVLAAIFGLLDMSVIESGTPARRTALTHMALNLSAVVLMLINLVVRVNADDDRVSVFGFILSLIVLVGLMISGWLGGKLAYHFGVRVADEGTQAEGFR